ncbi:Sigma-F factor [Bordetella parapertussis]|nr:hypothetical protein NB2BOR_A30190 [Bordetella parapertussis]SQH18137.1 Sigma-F factor [Bordetella parapertussis]SUV58796.1 Sigma-F factor [Bordetella parapertussis]VEF52550.1 Sigma-F factor [Bordetella parapertussis]VTR30147.1 Sigma-F factor [Bordetella parapertussis]
MPNPEDSLVQYAPLVRKLALQLLARLPSSVQLDDLVQAGMIGLLDAVRRYQESPDAQFETYATARIRGAMLDELRSQDWLPRSVRSKSRRIETAIQRKEQELMRAPSEGEIAEELGVPLAEYQGMLADAQGVQILHYEDFNTDGDSDSPWAESSAEHADPLDALLAGDLRRALIDAIDGLPEREKLLLSLCYEQGLNLKEIGAVLNVTEARVCQLRAQAPPPASAPASRSKPGPACPPPITWRRWYRRMPWPRGACLPGARPCFPSAAPTVPVPLRGQAPAPSPPPHGRLSPQGDWRLPHPVRAARVSVPAGTCPLPPDSPAHFRTSLFLLKSVANLP